MGRSNLKTVTGGPWNGHSIKLPFSGTFKFRVQSPATLITVGSVLEVVKAKNWCGYYNAEGFWIDCGSLEVPLFQKYS